MYANPMYANPMYANPMYANPMYANPMYANPVLLSPVYASPMYANPMYASEYKRTGKRSHSARPAAPPDLKPAALPKSNETVLILDTGIAPGGQLPPLLQGQSNLTGAPASEHDPPSQKGYLDPANCHGTFIAGVIQELAPDRNPRPLRVIEPMGDGKVSVIGPLLKDLAKNPKLVNDRTVLNLSFGGYAYSDMKLLKRGIRKVQEKGAVVVASAGNDATCRPMFPAAFPDVIGVGALAWDGAAPFSNHGDWVRACAPGSDLVSAFYTYYNGLLPALPLPGSGDPDEFEEWARWSGTSFAAPIVTAALLRTMALTGCTAKEAVTAVIDAPGLHRMPGLGTVVNLVTPFSAAS
jgi:subtilisin family serine protease